MRDLRTGVAVLVVGGAVALLSGCLSGTEAGGTEAGGTDPDPVVVDTAVSPSASAEPDPTEPAEPDPTEPVAAPDAVADGPAVNGPNTISAPLDGQSVPGPVLKVTGEGTAFEATLRYEVLVTGTDEVVVSDFTMAGANGEIGPYTFDVELEPGTYTLRVWEPEVSDGDGGDGPFRNLVEVDVTVT